MAIQGHTILELAREKKVNNRIKREVVKRVEKYNHITYLPNNVMGKGNFHDLVSPFYLMPYMQWFYGCLLTDKVNPNGDDVAGFCGLIAGDAEVVAQAGRSAYTGTNTKRGSYNSNESGEITGGFRNVFDWSTSQGNGTIASVCLTKDQLAIADYDPSRTIADTDVVNEWLQGSSVIELNADNTLTSCSIIDYEECIGYNVEYSSGTITVKEYEISTKGIHLLDNRLAARLIDTHTISQTVNNYGFATATVCYTGSAIHLITWQANTGNLYDYSINTSTWACTATSHTYNGVSLLDQDNYRQMYLSKDVFPIIGNYIYCFTTNGKIMKCNLLGNNDADVTEYTNPLGSISNGQNGPSIILQNGDWYKFGRYKAMGLVDDGIYYHNGVFNKIKYLECNNPSQSRGAISANGNNYGTVIGTGASSLSGRGYITLNSFFPWVSTVNNLDEAVTKTADLTMKLTYEITETAPT